MGWLKFQFIFVSFDLEGLNNRSKVINSPKKFYKLYANDFLWAL